MTLSGVVVAKLVTHGTPLGLSIAAGLLVGVGDRPDQRQRRRPREDRLVHRDPGHRIADPRPDHDGHQRHAGLERGARRQLRQARPDHDQRGHAARDLHAGGRPRDLVPARAHGDGTAPVRHRLQPGCRAAGRRAREPAALHLARDVRAPSRAPPASSWRRSSAAAPPRPARHICCRPSPQRSWARHSSRTAASTPGERSSPSCSWAPAPPAWRSRPLRSGRSPCSSAWC